MSKIKIGFKEAGKDLVFKEIECNLKKLQDLVGGLIEFVPTGIEGLDAIINEEGKLNGLLPNLRLGDSDVICGNVIFSRIDDEGENISINSDDERFLLNVVPKIAINEDEANEILKNIDQYLKFTITSFEN